MIDLVCEQKQVSVWNKLPWNTSCAVGVRWEVLIRQAYWQWSTHRETTKRCDIVGLLSDAAAMARIAILAVCFPTLWRLGAKRDILHGCDNPYVVVGKLFRGASASLVLLLLEVGERVGEGARTGSQHLNLGAAPDPGVPGPGKSERCSERATEGKGLEEVWLIGGVKTANGGNWSERGTK